MLRIMGPLVQEPNSVRETFVPLRYPPHEVPPVTRVRSTLVVSSVRELARCGRLEDYRAALPARLHPVILEALAGSWLDVNDVADHYRAVSTLDLPLAQQIAAGKAVGTAMQGYLIGPGTRPEPRAKASPWTVLRNARRTWDRIYVGGDVLVEKVGPTEAIRTMYGLSLNNIPYFRTATRSLLQLGIARWCERCVVSEIESTHVTLSLRISWV
jgi:hypothetical protein